MRYASLRRRSRNPNGGNGSSSVVIKLTVGELQELCRYDLGGRNGFERFMGQLRCRTDDDTGELDLDDSDLRAIRRYSHSGHRKRLQKVFKRPLGGNIDR